MWSGAIESSASVDRLREKGRCPNRLERLAKAVHESNPVRRADRAREAIASRIFGCDQDMRVVVVAQLRAKLRDARKVCARARTLFERSDEHVARCARCENLGVPLVQYQIDGNSASQEGGKQGRKRQRVADCIEADDERRR